jgi:hypothetical protein
MYPPRRPNYPLIDKTLVTPNNLVIRLFEREEHLLDLILDSISQAIPNIGWCEQLSGAQLKLRT